MSPIPATLVHSSSTILSSLIHNSKRYSKCKPPKCNPATPKQTMIIAICFGVAMFLIFILVVWYYRCCCCFSRRGDNRGAWQRVSDGLEGWTNGGVRPQKQPEIPVVTAAGFEAAGEMSTAYDAGSHHHSTASLLPSSGGHGGTGKSIRAVSGGGGSSGGNTSGAVASFGF